MQSIPVSRQIITWRAFSTKDEHCLELVDNQYQFDPSASAPGVTWAGCITGHGDDHFGLGFSIVRLPTPACANGMRRFIMPRTQGKPALMYVWVVLRPEAQRGDGTFRKHVWPCVLFLKSGKAKLISSMRARDKAIAWQGVPEEAPPPALLCGCGKPARRTVTGNCYDPKKPGGKGAAFVNQPVCGVCLEYMEDAASSLDLPFKIGPEIE